MGLMDATRGLGGLSSGKKRCTRGTAPPQAEGDQHRDRNPFLPLPGEAPGPCMGEVLLMLHIFGSHEPMRHQSPLRLPLEMRITLNAYGRSCGGFLKARPFAGN